MRGDLHLGHTMKKISIPFFIFSILVIFILLTGCTLPKGTSDMNYSENKTAVAIGIALNNTSVKTYLAEPWIVTDVSLNATTTLAGSGEEVTLHTPDVIIDTGSRFLHVYVDLDNRSVMYIQVSPKRVPLP